MDEVAASFQKYDFFKLLFKVVPFGIWKAVSPLTEGHQRG